MGEGREFQVQDPGYSGLGLEFGGEGNCPWHVWNLERIPGPMSIDQPQLVAIVHPGTEKERGCQLSAVMDIL
jgi:hypothetical protein